MQDLGESHQKPLLWSFLIIEFFSDNHKVKSLLKEQQVMCGPMVSIRLDVLVWGNMPYQPYTVKFTER